MTEWTYKHVYPVSGGYNDSLPSDAIPDQDSLNTTNIRFDRGRVIVDTGYTVFGQEVEGYPQLVYEFEKKDGTSEILLVTTTTLYKWNSISSEWDYVRGTITTNLDGNHAAGDVKLTVLDSTGLSDGDRIAVMLDDSSQHKSTVVDVPDATHVTLADPLPSVASDSAVVHNTGTLAGDISIVPTMATFSAVDKCYLANGKDNLKEYDGTSFDDAQNLPGGGVCIPRIVRVFDQYLVLINTLEGAAKIEYPQRVRYCDTADPTNWSSGNAGFTDLYDSEEHIIAAEILGPYMIIYRKESIVRMEHVGTSDTLFNFDTVVLDGGAVSVDSVINVGSYHAVMGPDNFYLYDGGFGIQTFGEKIWRKIFGPSGELSQDHEAKTRSFYVKPLGEFWWLIPTGSSSVPDLLLRYNTNYNSWSWRTFSHDMLGFGPWHVPQSTPWTALVGNWAEQSWTWNSMYVETSAPATLLLGYNPGRVYQYDYVSTGDPKLWTDEDGDATETQAVDYEFETKDMADPHFKVRFNIADLLLKGISVTVDISTDRGQSYESVSVLSPGGVFTESRVWKQIVGQAIRLKLSGSGGGFGLEWFGMQFGKESEW
jgi:hypothetical protein